jgi:drug/metabolite transporter (DMT)-like permease
VPVLAVAAEPQKETRFYDLAALLALYVIWGSTYYGLRVALESFPPFLLAGGRMIVAGSLLYAILRLRGAPRPTRANWGAAAIVGFLLLSVGNGAVTWAEQSVSSSLAAVVVATMPLWAAVLGRFSGERPSPLEWAGLLVGFAGVALLNLGGELRGALLPALALAIAPLSWALGSVWSRRLPLARGPMATATEMLTGGALMLAFGVARGEHVTQAPSTRAVVALVYLVLFGSMVAFSAYTYLLRRARPAVATSYAYVNPLVAIAIGVGIGGEHIGALGWVAAAVIVAGVALISLGRARR